MTSPHAPDDAPQPTRSRRAAIVEMASLAVVVAIPIGAIMATATPIPNPPPRETLNVLTPAREEVMRQRREVEAERRRANRRQRRNRATPAPGARHNRRNAERRASDS